MVWVGRGFIDHLVPTPCHGQAHLPLDKVAQSPIQTGLEQFQGGSICKAGIPKFVQMYVTSMVGNSSCVIAAGNTSPSRAAGACV